MQRRSPCEPARQVPNHQVRETKIPTDMRAYKLKMWTTYHTKKRSCPQKTTHLRTSPHGTSLRRNTFHSNNGWQQGCLRRLLAQRIKHTTREERGNPSTPIAFASKRTSPSEGNKPFLLEFAALNIPSTSSRHRVRLPVEVKLTARHSGTY